MLAKVGKQVCKWANLREWANGQISEWAIEQMGKSANPTANGSRICGTNCQLPTVNCQLNKFLWNFNGNASHLHCAGSISDSFIF